MKINLGDKLYRYYEEKDSVELLRVVKIKNENSFILKNENTNDKVRLNMNDIDNYYKKLRPDGYINFSIIELDYGLKDVVVTLYRNKDLQENPACLPFAICRQNVLDLFTNSINTIENRYYVGISVSQESIPQDVDFRIMLACNKINYNISLSIYLDDTLDFILSLINHSKYNTILTSLSTSAKPNMLGYVKTLKDLLIQSDFMFDFHRAFDIDEVDFKVEYLNDTEICPEQRIYLENKYKCEMFKTYCFKYTKEINLKEIKRDYVMICDKDKDVYIIAYDKGKYINRNYANNIKDKRDAITMMKLKNKVLK